MSDGSGLSGSDGDVCHQDGVMSHFVLGQRGLDGITFMPVMVDIYLDYV